jgi:hypothetical protein
MTTPKRRVQRKPPAKKAPAKRKAPVRRKAAPRKKKYARPGQPTKYRQEYCERVVELSRDGKTLTALAVELGVMRSTLYNWQDKHSEFMDACTRARDAARAWWEQTMSDQSTGRNNGNSGALLFAMKNQFPDDYRDRKEHKVDATQTVELNFLGFDGTPIDFGDDD